MKQDSFTFTAPQIRELLYYNRDVKQKDCFTPSAQVILADVQQFIADLADNKIHFADKSPRLAYKLSETLLYESYNQEGIYSDTARRAMVVLCQKQGILPALKPLTDRKISFFKTIKNKAVRFAQKHLFKQDCVINDSTRIQTPAGFMSKGFYQTRIMEMDAKKPSKIHTLWHKYKKYAAGFALFVVSLGFNGDGQGHTLTQPVKLKPQAAMKKNTVSSKQKILEHKTFYITSVKQARQNMIFDNYYNTYLELRLKGASNRTKYYNDIQKQIDQGIFKLDNGISLPHFAHALYVSRIYERNSIIQHAATAQKPLTAEQQMLLTQYIKEIGKKGEKLQARSIAKYGFRKTNDFEQAPKALRELHLRNLRQVNALD